MKVLAAGLPQSQDPCLAEDDVAYYERRAIEEQERAALASSEVARSAHLAPALIYDDQVDYLIKRPA
jgi:hypothetical protein